MPGEGLANGDDAFTGKACRDDLWDRHQGIKVQLLEQTGLKVHQGVFGWSQLYPPPGLLFLLGNESIKEQLRSSDWADEQAVSAVPRGEARSHRFSEMRLGYKRAENNCPKWGKGLESYSRDLRKRTEELLPGASEEGI